jgi:hypothetical protein
VGDAQAAASRDVDQVVGVAGQWCSGGGHRVPVGAVEVPPVGEPFDPVAVVVDDAVVVGAGQDEVVDIGAPAVQPRPNVVSVQVAARRRSTTSGRHPQPSELAQSAYFRSK